MNVRPLFYISLCCFLVFSCQENKVPTPVFQSSQVFPDSNQFAPQFPVISHDFRVASKAYANKFYRERIFHHGYSGTFLVAKNGQVIFERTTGYFNKKQKQKLKSNDPIHVASISKVATAIQILRLCDRGLIDLNADVRIYLKDFPYKDITVKMLLNHRSGLPYYGYFSDNSSIWNRKKLLTNRDVLKLIKKHQFKPYFPPNKKFSYCNTNYVMLALIAEEILQKPFPQIMREEFFNPLGMSNSFIADTSTNFKNVCQSYRQSGASFKFNFLDGIYGDKNMYTTARDLLKMDVASYNSNFLSDSIKALMFKGYSFEKRKGAVNYGLGIRMYLFKGKKPFYYHTGWWHGNSACYASLRTDTLCVIALSNQFTKSVYQVRNMTPYFGNYPSDFSYESLDVEE
ncbi:MAG: serine hydrolase domain-containing protein [Bacteroidota bacterium]